MGRKADKKHGDILFSFLKKRVNELSRSKQKKDYKAFIHWFVETHYSSAYDVQITDGPFDGKIDGIARIEKSNQVQEIVINSKYTGRLNALAPKEFYKEIAEFSKPFLTPSFRDGFLANKVKEELQSKYKNLYDRYDDKAVSLIFITNYKQNKEFCRTKTYKGVRVFHYDDLKKYLLDDIDGALPKTDDLVLKKISKILSARKRDTEVPTSIVFARLKDFLDYMKKDELGTLFSRNVRVALAVKKDSVNEGIMDTFEGRPTEFTYSNNGITLICDSSKKSVKGLVLKNPRVVNGSQTLHSVQKAFSQKKKPGETNAETRERMAKLQRSANLARVMVKIIEVPLHSADANGAEVTKRKEIVNNIATRTNRQNPIKGYNLAANDEYQLAIFRYLKARGYYYDRRVGEYKKSIRSNRDRGLKEGPNIRLAMQLSASITNDLGPAAAKLSVDALFAKPYNKIKTTNPEVILQSYILYSHLRDISRDLAGKDSKIEKLKGHYDFALFAIASNAFRSYGFHLGDIRHFSRLNACIEYEDKSKSLRKNWDLLVKEITRFIWTSYKKSDVTPNNFFKTNLHVENLMERRVNRQIKAHAKELLTSFH